jgi:hypothetical protein
VLRYAANPVDRAVTQRPADRPRGIGGQLATGELALGHRPTAASHSAGDTAWMRSDGSTALTGSTPASSSSCAYSGSARIFARARTSSRVHPGASAAPSGVSPSSGIAPTARASPSGESCLHTMFSAAVSSLCSSAPHCSGVPSTARSIRATRSTAPRAPALQRWSSQTSRDSRGHARCGTDSRPPARRRRATLGAGRPAPGAP